MDFKHLFTSIDGRIGRKEFWIGALSLSVIGVIFSLINPIAGIVAAIALLFFHVCVQGKRWHDRGKSAWWVLISFIPLVGPIWVLVECGCLAGSPEVNEYGPAPVGGAVPSPTITTP